MNRSLAFFGAFNPPTSAHLSLARYAMERTGAAEVVFVPSKSSYIRDGQGKDFAYTDAQRLAMLRAAASVRPWMRVYDGEILQEAQPRTYATLCRLRDEGTTAALLIGSDKLAELETGWRNVRGIAEEFGIVCLRRGDDACARMLREDPYLRTLAPYIHLLETPPETRHVSSTAVRRQVKIIREAREAVAAMVPEEIIPYVIG